MRGEMYDFNLLVSCPWGVYGRAKKEIVQVLEMLGDEGPLVKRTIAEGIIGVKTSLDPREVIRGLRRLFNEDPFSLQYTLKWVPVDLWTLSDMDSMKEAVRKLRNRIHAGERWRMTVEKRRYNRHHRIEIIRELADLIDEKVDLENPEKILRVDIIGRYAGISVLTPEDIFSVAKPYSGTP
ncbi:MAG: THUMP domain-containing protein [Candidatus Bathyarchaeia archaeon]